MTRRAALCAVLLLACGLAEREVYEVTGRVRSIDAAQSIVVIEHDAIPGFMPDMTMSFDVASAELLDGLTAGSRIRFELERSATLLRILSIDVIEAGQGGADAPPGKLLKRAPDFDLVDQQGRPFRLSDHRGSALLLDFIFTRCAGPCPILTSAHADLQRQLPPEIARRTRFISISLDPEYDTPARLTEYARSRHANLHNWSFLTGEPATVQAVIRAYQVGTRSESGVLEHLVVSYLVDPSGEIAKRYTGLEHQAAEILEDLREVLDAPS